MIRAQFTDLKKQRSMLENSRLKIVWKITVIKSLKNILKNNGRYSSLRIMSDKHSQKNGPNLPNRRKHAKNKCSKLKTEGNQWLSICLDNIKTCVNILTTPSNDNVLLIPTEYPTYNRWEMLRRKLSVSILNSWKIKWGKKLPRHVVKHSSHKITNWHETR